MKHKEWLALVSPDSVRASALKAGIKPRTLAAQLEEERLSPENVIALARAYGVGPVRALVDTEYITAGEAGHEDSISNLYRATEEELVAEVLRRMKIPAAQRLITTPVDQLIVQPAPDPARRLRSITSVPDEEEILEAENESLEGKAAAQKRTPPLEEEHP